MPRLMLLDAILDAPEVVWLQTARERVDHFTKRLGVPAAHLPRQVRRRGDHESYRAFPDALPIGVDPSARPVFIFPKTDSVLFDLRPFLRRHRALWTDLPTWTLRLVFPPGEYLSDSLWKAPLHDEIGVSVGMQNSPGEGIQNSPPPR
jgi:hypothetical protein